MKATVARADDYLTRPPFIEKLIMFSLPLVLSAVLQLLYSSADLIVVGRFSENSYLAQAAISSTQMIVHLILSLFIGLSVGINVSCAKSLGAKNGRYTSDIVHTSVLLALISGIVVGAIGIGFCDVILELMQSPPEVKGLSAIYLKIYFLGSPFNLLYNFGAAVLRSRGETKKPLIYLAVSGAVNVGLNLFFVIVLDLSVAGVAIATVVSQIISSLMIVFALVREKGDLKLNLKKIRIDRAALNEIIRIGIPAGIQASLFSVSNVIIQSSVNSFGSEVMAGNGNSLSIEGYVGVAVESLSHAATAFTAQNYGAKNKRNVSLVIKDTAILMTVINIVLPAITLLFRKPLLHLFSTEENVVKVGELRMFIMLGLYISYGLMQLFVSYLRGFGKSALPMFISLLGICVLRIIWIYTAYRLNPSLEMLYTSYPLSWIITAIAQFIAFKKVKKRVFKSLPDEDLSAAETENN